jgi:hypothetical protein
VICTIRYQLKAFFAAGSGGCWQQDERVHVRF